MYSPYKVYGVPVALSSIYTSSSTIYRQNNIFSIEQMLCEDSYGPYVGKGQRKRVARHRVVPYFIWNGGKTERPYLSLQTGKHTRLVQAESIFASVVLKSLSQKAGESRSRLPPAPAASGGVKESHHTTLVAPSPTLASLALRGRPARVLPVELAPSASRPAP